MQTGKTQQHVIYEDDEITTIVDALRTNDDTARFEIQTNTPGVYGYFSIDVYGDWTYILDNSNPKTHALEDGDRVHDIFPVTVSNANGQSITSNINISIFGKDDKMELTKPRFYIDDDMTTGVVTEDDTATTAIGKLYTNIENAIFDIQIGTNGQYGQFSITRDGYWIYKLDNSRDETQALNDEDKRIEVFPVSATSDEKITAVKEVRITVLGKDEEIPIEERPFKLI